MRNFLIHISYLVMILMMTILVDRLSACMENGSAEEYAARIAETAAVYFSWLPNKKNIAEIQNEIQAQNGESTGNDADYGYLSENQVILPKQEEPAEQMQQNIRVLLSSEQGYLHDEMELTFDEEYYIQNGQEIYYGDAGTSLNEDDLWNLFARQGTKQHEIIIGVWSEAGWDMEAEWKLAINQQPLQTYQGILIIAKKDMDNDDTGHKTEGFYLVNQLPLENYLYYVLPSEMPSDFPIEAQKAQAVCARSYAMLQIQQGRLEEYGADVDDTASFQVYHAQGTTETAIKAVNETRGEYLSYRGTPIEAFYYACSCGHSATADIWRDSASHDYSYLTYHDYGALEQDCPWFRWTYYAKTFDINALKNGLQAMLGQNGDMLRIYRKVDENGEFQNEIDDPEAKQMAVREMNNIQDIEIVERLTGDVANKLHIVCNGLHMIVEGEYNIRKVLAADNYTLVKQDMSISSGLSMVPSGFFEIEVVKQDSVVAGYVLKGGGFGHGVGMSQYGARYLAEEGKDYNYILTYYYENVTIENELD